MTMTVLRIDVNGTVTAEEMTGDTLQELYRLIGCHTVTRVPLSSTLDMWLDDEGALVPDLERNLNKLATAFCSYTTGSDQPLFGNVVLAAEENEDIAGLPDHDLTSLPAFLSSLQTFYATE